MRAFPRTLQIGFGKGGLNPHPHPALICGRNRFTELKSSCYRDNEVWLRFWPRPSRGPTVSLCGISEFHHPPCRTAPCTSYRPQSRLIPLLDTPHTSSDFSSLPQSREPPLGRFETIVPPLLDR